VISADNPLPGDPFFGPDGKVTAFIQQALDFLTMIERSRLSTSLAVSSLAQAGVIKPWPITIKNEQGDRPVQGLSCIERNVLETARNGGITHCLCATVVDEPA
jgi:hypothetical protein